MSSKIHYLQLAALASKSSKMAMLHGSVLVQGHRIVSVGFNDIKHAEVDVIERYRSAKHFKGEKGKC